MRNTSQVHILLISLPDIAFKAITAHESLACPGTNKCHARPGIGCSVRFRATFAWRFGRERKHSILFLSFDFASAKGKAIFIAATNLLDGHFERGWCYELPVHRLRYIDFDDRNLPGRICNSS